MRGRDRAMAVTTPRNSPETSRHVAGFDGDVACPLADGEYRCRPARAGASARRSPTSPPACVGLQRAISAAMAAADAARSRRRRPAPAIAAAVSRLSPVSITTPQSEVVMGPIASAGGPGFTDRRWRQPARRPSSATYTGVCRRRPSSAAVKPSRVKAGHVAGRHEALVACPITRGPADSARTPWPPWR